MARRLRLALVGLNYGRAYLPAIAAVREVELVALGARGSRASRGLARRLGLPLHLGPEGLLSARPELAVVAVPPGQAPGVVGPLLEAGCHVLCEFPVDAGLARLAARLGRRSGARFEVNAHFSQLPAASAFIRRCRREGQPAVVSVLCHERTLYACLDTLQLAFGQRFVPGRALGGPGRGGVVLGRLGPAQAAVQVTPLLSPRDDGSDVFFGLRISAGFATGRTLTLVDALGPVLASGASPLELRLAALGTPLRALDRARQEANRACLQRFARACLQGRAPAASTPTFLDVARSYSETVARLGWRP